MNTYLHRVLCFLRQSIEAARGITEDVHVHERIARDVLRMTAELDLDRPPPVIGRRFIVPISRPSGNAQMDLPEPALQETALKPYCSMLKSLMR